MARSFAEIAFTEKVKAFQERQGSRHVCERPEASQKAPDPSLGERETVFIAARASFYMATVYMATVGETGWPYIRRQGGPAGFVRVIDEKTIGLADFRGNRQYVGVGNLMGNDRVALFFMDHPSRARLKLFGRARIVAPEDDATLARLTIPGYPAWVERGVLIAVEAFDWNCSQHVAERLTLGKLARMVSRP